ncbi:GNAT family N-acetyltransferase [Mycoplasmatota bacterium]|nr:GNAT family N-acetyltransferase [Mycoplasmatota bacterium]
MGKITVEQSKHFSLDMIKEIYALDKLVYSEHMAGSIEDDANRYQKVPDAFILLKDDEKIIGYLCFFPVSKDFYKQMLESDEMYDNNIGPDDIVLYEKGMNHHIFIISMVIHPLYKSQGLFRKVLKKFKKVLIEYHNQSMYISNISGYAVSGAGEHILKSFGSELVKEVDDCGELGKLYMTDFYNFSEVFKP